MRGTVILLTVAACTRGLNTPAQDGGVPPETTGLEWSAGPSIGTAVDKAVVAGDRIFAFGLDNAFVSHLGTNGMPGQWVSLPNQRLPGATSLAFVSSGENTGWLVAAGGGCGFGGTLNSIQAAQVAGDGSLGSWKTLSLTLSSPRCLP